MEGVTVAWVAIALALFVLVAGVLSFNRFVSQRNLIRDSWSNVESELQRRYDLIPKLVDTARAYAAHERDVLETVVHARAAAMASRGSPAQQADEENRLVGSVQQLFAVAERYPALRAAEAFMQVQRALVDTEDRIQLSRRIYNANVRDHNQRIQAIPSNVVARIAGFREAEYFEVEPAVRVPPTVAPAAEGHPG